MSGTAHHVVAKSRLQAALSRAGPLLLCHRAVRHGTSPRGSGVSRAIGGREILVGAGRLIRWRHHAWHAGWHSWINSRRRAARSVSGTSSYMQSVGSAVVRQGFFPGNWSEKPRRGLPDSPTASHMSPLSVSPLSFESLLRECTHSLPPASHVSCTPRAPPHLSPIFPSVLQVLFLGDFACWPPEFFRSDQHNPRDPCFSRRCTFLSSWTSSSIFRFPPNRCSSRADLPLPSRTLPGCKEADCLLRAFAPGAWALPPPPVSPDVSRVSKGVPGRMPTGDAMLSTGGPFPATA